MENNLKDDFVAYEQALALKKLGYDKQCLAYYGYWKKLYPIDTDFVSFRGLGDGCLAAPLKQQVFRWFREKYDLPSHIDTHWQHDWNNYSYQWSITENHEVWTSMEHYKTHKEAENACIDKLIELAKNQIS